MNREQKFKIELDALCKKYYGDNWVYDNIKEEGDSSAYTIWMKIIVWYSKQDELKKQQKKLESVAYGVIHDETGKITSYPEMLKELYENKGEM